MKRFPYFLINTLVSLSLSLSSALSFAQAPIQPLNEKSFAIEETIRKAQRLLEKSQNDSNAGAIDLFVAISKSMPRASLERLAQDAARAQVPLIIQGVGEKPSEKRIKKTVLETYGHHWLTRHMDDWAFVTQTHATLQIDPTRFKAAAIDDVPQVIVMKHCQKSASCSGQPSWIVRARGDVTLDYALEHLLANINTQALPESDAKSVKAILQNALVRLRKGTFE